MDVLMYARILPAGIFGRSPPLSAWLWQTAWKAHVKMLTHHARSSSKIFFQKLRSKMLTAHFGVFCGHPKNRGFHHHVVGTVPTMNPWESCRNHPTERISKSLHWTSNPLPHHQVNRVVGWRISGWNFLKVLSKESARKIRDKIEEI